MNEPVAWEFRSIPQFKAISKGMQAPGTRPKRTIVVTPANALPIQARRLCIEASNESVDLSPKLRQTVKSQTSVNGELTHGIVST